MRARRGTSRESRSPTKRKLRFLQRHLSTADEHFGLRLGAGLFGTLIAAVTFALLLLLVRAGWAPLRGLDTGVADMFNRIDADHPELVRAAEAVSEAFDPNVFRVVLALVALVYLIRGERHHATWLVVTRVYGTLAGWAVALLIFIVGFGIVALVRRRKGPDPALATRTVRYAKEEPRPVAPVVETPELEPVA